MDDYISRQAAIDDICETVSDFQDVLIPIYYMGLIKALPAADVVPVVRCRDCKHLYKDGECPLRTWYTHVEEDFCSYGERKEKEHD